MDSSHFMFDKHPWDTFTTGLRIIFCLYTIAEVGRRANNDRIWAAIKREALLTVAEGVATPEEVDAIFKEVLKTPKGPCEQMDVVGLDVTLNIEEHYAETRPGLPESPRELLRKMIAEKRLGVKSGHGFYRYESRSSVNV